MAKFIPTNKFHPCPICQNTSGDCRSFPDSPLVLCQKSPYGEFDSPDYQYKKPTKDGIWGIYAPRREEWSEQQKKEYREERKRQEQWRQEQERKALATKLSPIALDTYSRQLIEHYGLREQHRRVLIETRKLNKNLLGSFFSFDPKKPLPTDIPRNFPGYPFLWKESGIACPAFDTQEKIIGWQLRIDDKTDGGKYKWIRNPHLNNGELPITVINPTGSSPDTQLWSDLLSHRKDTETRGHGDTGIEKTWHLAEGVLKPFIASSRLNLPFIGSPGGLFDNSPQQLQKALEGAKTVVLCPDGGDIVNKHVVQRWRRVTNFLHSLNVEVQFAWWGQRTKTDPDIDEISPETEISYLTPAQFFDLCVLIEDNTVSTESGQSDKTISQKEWEQTFKVIPFLKGLAAQQHQLSKHSKTKGFSLVTPKFLPKLWNYDPEIAFPTPQDYQGRPAPEIRFQKGQRLSVAIAAQKAGWKLINDGSDTGQGKSYDFGQLAPNPEGKGKIWYITPHHRHPSTPTVKANFFDMPSRTETGYWRHGDGKLYSQPEHQEDKPEITPNCHQANKINTFNRKGYDLEGNNPYCQGGCPFYHQCKKEKGDGYGFLYLRKQAFEQRLIRTDWRSLPHPDDYDYSHDTLIWEEFGEQLQDSQEVVGNYEDFLKQFDHIRRKSPESYKLLEPLQNKLHQLLSGGVNQGIYGLNHEEILQTLTGWDNLPVKLVFNLIQLDCLAGLLFIENHIQYLGDVIQVALDIINPVFDTLITQPDSVTGFGGDDLTTGKMIRRQFRQESRQESLERLEALPNNLLTEVLLVLTEEKRGRFRVNFDQFKVIIPYQRQQRIIQAAKGNYFLDATGNLKDLAQVADCPEEDILPIRQEPLDHSNHTIYAINVQGLGSRLRSDTAQKRVDAVLEEIPHFLKQVHGLEDELIPQVLDFKGQEGIDGYWFLHNRGTNEFAGEQVLAAVGTPNGNLGQLQDEYFIRYQTLEGFEDWYNYKVSAEYKQTPGRHRAHLYPHQNFYTFFIGTDWNFDPLQTQGYEVVHLEGFDITPEAGTADQQTKYKIHHFAQQLLKAGEKLTQVRLAQAMGKTQGLISQVIRQFQGGWRQFKKLLVSLYKPINRGTNNFSLEDIRELEEWVGRNPLEHFQDMMEVFSSGGWDNLEAYLENFPDTVRAGLLGLLTSLFVNSESVKDMFGVSPPLEREFDS